jgi:hypothetical protein
LDYAGRGVKTGQKLYAGKQSGAGVPQSKVLTEIQIPEHLLSHKKEYPGSWHHRKDGRRNSGVYIYNAVFSCKYATVLQNFKTSFQFLKFLRFRHKITKLQNSLPREKEYFCINRKNAVFEQLNYYIMELA